MRADLQNRYRVRAANVDAARRVGARDLIAGTTLVLTGVASAAATRLKPPARLIRQLFAGGCLCVCFLTATASQASLTPNPNCGISGGHTPTPFRPGQLYVGAGLSIQHFDASGDLLDRLSDTTGFKHGGAFDSDGHLLVAVEESGGFPGHVFEFDNSGNCLGDFGDGSLVSPQSIVIDAAGNVYVSDLDATTGQQLKRFDSAGNLLMSFTPAVQDQGVNWIDLAPDQCTMYYTSNGDAIKAFDVCTNSQLPDLLIGDSVGPKNALRVRANGEVLVAATDVVERFDSLGRLLQTYSFPGNIAFSLALDPDGKHFWVGDVPGVPTNTAGVYHYDINTGFTGSSFSVEASAGGLAVFGLPDSDGDGLPDDWEMHGVTIDGVFIDLPSMGANPLHKDIFVHVDVMQPDPAQPQVNFDPDPHALKLVSDAFFLAPVDNPDGKPGIHLHVDAGPNSVMDPVTGHLWGALSRSGTVPFQHLVFQTPPKTIQEALPTFAAFRTVNFVPARRGAVFRYALLCDQVSDIAGGQADDLPGTSFVVSVVSSLGTRRGPIKEASLFMHELGHDLGLHHGGSDEVNFKPNYISIMNYRFDTIGLLNPNTPHRSIDYSRRALATLDETAVDELTGIADPESHLTIWNMYTRNDVPPGADHCLHDPEFFRAFYPSQALDWNCDGAKTPTPVIADVNGDSKCVVSGNAVLATVPAGDDVIIEGPVFGEPHQIIVSGPNRKCETVAAQPDTQLTEPESQEEPPLLTGFADWPALNYSANDQIGSVDSASRARQSLAVTDGGTFPIELPFSRVLIETPPELLAEVDAAPLDEVTLSPSSGPAPLLVTFDGSASTAVDDTIVDWSWDFGDGTTGSGATTQHTYRTPGEYFASLTVTDGHGHVNLVPLRTRVSVGPNESAPVSNLVPYQPPTWSDKIVVSNVTGTNVDTPVLSSSDLLYVDWAVINDGQIAAMADFLVALYVDGVLRQSFLVPHPLDVNSYAFIEDYPIGALSSGQHPIKIVIDPTDAVDPAGQTHNEYSKVLNITGSLPTSTPTPGSFPSATSTPTPPATPATPTPTAIFMPDIHGTWQLGTSCGISCSAIAIGQNGGSISIGGGCATAGTISLTGTLDAAGHIAGSGTSQFICSSLAITATAAPDSNSLSGTLTCGGFGDCSLTGTRTSTSIATPSVTPAPSSPPPPTSTPNPCIAAHMISPAAGSVIQSSTTFTWSPGTGNTSYYLFIGTKEAGGDDAFHNQYQSASTSALVNYLPEGPLHVRLRSLCLGNTTDNDYTYSVPLRAAGAGSIDSSFRPTATTNGGQVFATLVQPDGKIIVGGAFKSFAGCARSGIARLNPDGTCDQTFDPGLALSSQVESSVLPSDFDSDVSAVVQLLALQPDGKILLHTGGNAALHHGLYRLNTDGTLDSTFDADIRGSGIQSIVVQPDGKILIAGAFLGQPNGTFTTLARLNPDGGLDPTFATMGHGGSTPVAVADVVALQPDGKIIVGGTRLNSNDAAFGAFVLKRLNSDGTNDNTFTTPLCVGSVTALALQSDGSIVAAGGFTFNGSCGSATTHIARFHSNGTRDNGFSDPVTSAAGTPQLVVQSDDALLFSTAAGFTTAVGTVNVARLQSDGTLDNTFDTGTGFTRFVGGGAGSVFGVAVTPTANILVAGLFDFYDGARAESIVQLKPDGSLDGSFAANGPGANAEVVALAQQPDGKWLVGLNPGNNGLVGLDQTTKLNGVTAIGIGRLNVDGSTDTSFVAPFQTGSFIAALARQNDGKVVVSGKVYLDGSSTPVGLVRLNTDGSVDPTFTPPSYAGNGPMLIQPDGKIVVAGFATDELVVRLNGNGELDAILQDLGRSAGITSMLLQGDGKILIGGSFTFVTISPGHTVARNNIARLNQDGSADVSFDPGSGPSYSSVAFLTMALEPDGKILIGGTFYQYDGVATPDIARVNSNGSLDTSFVPVNPNTAQFSPAQGVGALALQMNGGIVVGPDIAGTATSPMSMFRIGSDGTLDPTFALRSGSQGFGTVGINAFGIQSDGKIFVAGAFDAINGSARMALARLLGDTIAPTPTSTLAAAPTATPTALPGVPPTSTPTPTRTATPGVAASGTRTPSPTNGPTPEPTATAIEPDRDPYLCYGAKTTKKTPRFAKVAGRVVEDALDSAVVDATSLVEMCAPATVDGLYATAPGHDTHLMRYGAKGPKFAKVTNQLIVSALGATTLDVQKRSALALPAAVSTTGVPNGLGTPGVEPFLCYGVKPHKGAPKPLPILSVPIGDRFGVRQFDLRKPVQVCVPARLDGEPTEALSQPGSLICFGLRVSKGAPKLPKLAAAAAHTSDRFGDLVVDVGKPRELCMPALRNP